MLENVSILHKELQLSPLIKLPSSHYSVPNLILSPHTVLHAPFTNGKTQPSLQSHVWLHNKQVLLAVNL